MFQNDAELVQLPSPYPNSSFLLDCTRAGHFSVLKQLTVLQSKTINYHRVYYVFMLPYLHVKATNCQSIPPLVT